MIPFLKKIRTDNSDLRQVQEATGLVLDQVIRRDILDGVIVENIELISGLNIVNHTLARAPKGFIIVSKDANQNVWNAGPLSKVDPKRSIALQSSGAVTVSIWFF